VSWVFPLERRSGKSGSFLPNSDLKGLSSISLPEAVREEEILHFANGETPPPLEIAEK
jgi:hypothetical protein